MTTSIKWIVQTQVPDLCPDRADWTYCYDDFHQAVADIFKRNENTKHNPLIKNRLIKRTIVETDEIIGEM